MLQTKIRLPKSRYYIEVFLWNTRKELQKHTRRKGGKTDYGGIYLPESYIILPRKKIKPKLGEIHFYKERVGVGLISHEVLHCVLDYLGKTGILIDDDHHDNNERLCFYQGEIVRKIGLWFLKIKVW